MENLILLPLFLIGLGFGILLNSLADNLPPDAQGVRRGPRRLRCAQCSTVYAPLFWLATLRWLLRGGRCPHCAQRERLRPLLLELACGAALAFLWGWAAGDVFKYFTACVIVLTFALITVIDMEHRLILWVVIWPTVVAIALLNSLDPDRGPEKTLVGGVVGYGLIFLVFLLAQGFSAILAKMRGQPLDEIAFGGGDVNLAAAVGVAAGWSGVLFALVIAIFAGGAYSLGYLIVQSLRGKYQAYTALPYGPFLVLGGLVMYLYGKEFAAWYFAQ